MREFEEVALAFDAACREAGVRYVMVGGIAVMAWGQPRTTMDIDTIVSLRRAQVEGFMSALRRHQLRATAQDFLDSMEDGSHVTVHASGSAFHIEVKLSDSKETETELDRAREERFEGRSLRIASPEDTIAWKLRFGSPQDVADARSIWIRQKGKLDLAALWATAEALGVDAALRDLERD